MYTASVFINDLYLSAELHQQLSCIGTVGCQAAHCSTEVCQAGDWFIGLGGSTGPVAVSRAGCGTGGETCATRCCQTHQPNQSPNVCQAQRLQTSCKAAARATVGEDRWAAEMCGGMAGISGHFNVLLKNAYSQFLSLNIQSCLTEHLDTLRNRLNSPSCLKVVTNVKDWIQ